MGQMQSFINKLFHQEDNACIQSSPLPSSDRLVDYQPLLDLQDKRQLVQVEVLNRNHAQTYQSMIVRLDFVRGAIYLDALTPLSIYNPVVVGDTLVIKHHDHGQILVVEGELLDIVTDDNELYYVMALPQEIGYKQRRFHPRLEVNNHNAIKLRLWSPLRIPWYTRVENISAGGARLAIGGNIGPQLKKGLQLPNCDVELNSGQNLRCKCTVKTFRYQRRPYEHTQVSVEFNDLGYQQKNWLLQWVDFNSRQHAVGLSRC